MGRPDFYVSARVWCDNGHEHQLCVLVDRQVHPRLRCAPGGPVAGMPGGSPCQLPPDLQSRVHYELRENFQESLRRGWVEVRAA